MLSKNIPNLDNIVLAGLDFFQKNKPPRLSLTKGSTRFVVGSVNAYNTGRMLFHGQSAFLADEGSFKDALKTYRHLIKQGTIKEAIIISASGEKDSIWEIKAAQKAGLKTSLLTCNAESSGAKIADQVFCFRKIAEPYSYNFSTYLGMILSSTKEDPKAIKDFISRLNVPSSFKKQSFFTFILPDKYKAIVDMLNVKNDELFGPYASLRAYPEGAARHAKFICKSPKEMIVSLGKNDYFGEKNQRWEINLPQKSNFALVLALAYYLAGLIQKQKPPYFKRGLPEYCLKSGPKPYGQTKPFAIIVPGN
ncbi:MAG: hypothetical protein WC441_00230 [Patescibacteria group bacterium]